MTKRKNSLINFIIALVPVMVLAVVVGTFLDYYYELNDDVLMKDILSGMYAGIPSGYNIQMQWPLSAFIALLYKICPSVSWYGLLLLVFQYGSLIIIGDRLIKNISKTSLKILTAVSVTLMFASYMLFHMNLIQYTVTVSMMAGAAIAILATCDDTKTPKAFLFSNIPTIVILFLGFMLRSEMMLLMMPFVCATAVYKWSLKDLFSKETITKYLSAFLVIAGSFLIAAACNKIAYSSQGWADFMDLFNARTELYDYQTPPQYEGNTRFYEGVGLSKEEAILFENYNYGISPKVDNNLMWAVANYAGDVNSYSRSTIEKLSEKIKIYIYEFTHVWNTPGADYPWNIAVILLYILCVLIIILSKDYIGLWKVIALFAGRSAIWIYMLMGERTPKRITDSLYFVETVTLIFLLSMLIISRHNSENKSAPADTASTMQKARSVIAITIIDVVAIALGMVFLIDAVPQLKYELVLKDVANAPYLEFYEYINRHPDKFYLMDTYSSVAYSEKMFDDTAHIDKSNMNTLGGWAALSPIENEKLKQHGLNNMYEGLLNEDVYFCKQKDIDMTWLEEFYKAQGNDINVTLEDTVSSFEIYKVTAK